jgi:hypothetical protein
VIDVQSLAGFGITYATNTSTFEQIHGDPKPRVQGEIRRREPDAHHWSLPACAAISFWIHACKAATGTRTLEPMRIEGSVPAAINS